MLPLFGRTLVFWHSIHRCTGSAATAVLAQPSRIKIDLLSSPVSLILNPTSTVILIFDPISTCLLSGSSCISRVVHNRHHATQRADPNPKH